MKLIIILFLCHLILFIHKYESDITTYLSYVIMDKMLVKGYTFPIRNGQRMVEVGSIVVDNKTNILKTDKNYGDIDVLALDCMSKEKFNIEIKHYIPAMSLTKLKSETELNISCVIFNKKV